MVHEQTVWSQYLLYEVFGGYFRHGSGWHPMTRGSILAACKNRLDTSFIFAGRLVHGRMLLEISFFTFFFLPALFVCFMLSLLL